MTYDPYYQDASMRFRFTEGTVPPPHFEEVLPMQGLLRLKTKKQLHITIAIPTLNEEATISSTLANITPLTIQGAGLIDRLVVIDSNSADKTREKSNDMGIEVINAADAFHELGIKEIHGKGANIAFVSAENQQAHELIVFCDADFNVKASQIQGVLSPLIAKDHTQVSLAWMDRVTHEGKRSNPGKQGGRATRFTFKPVIKTLYPELDGLQQPISGLFAARGSALLDMQFPTDYRIETALLTHIADNYRELLKKDQDISSPFAQTFCGIKDQTGQSNEKIEVVSYQIAMQAITSAWAAGREPQLFETITLYALQHDSRLGTRISSTVIPMPRINMPSPIELTKRNKKSKR